MERLRQARLVAVEMEKIIHNLEVMMNEVRTLASLPAGRRIPLKAIEAEVKDMKKAMQAGMYGKKCAMCSGKGCPACDDMGWTAKGIF